MVIMFNLVIMLNIITCYNFFFDKKSSSDAVTRAWSETLVTIDKSDIKTKNMPNQHLAQANC